MDTVAKGNAFRNSVRDFLRAAGYQAETEVILGGKTVDVFARKPAFGGEDRIAIEAKDVTGNLQVDEVHHFFFFCFIHAYSNVIRLAERIVRC